MHIAFVTPEYPPVVSGGIGTSIRNLARALVDKGHRVSVVGWGQAAEFDDHGVRVRFLWQTYPWKTGWFTSRRLLQHELRRMVRDEHLAIAEAPDWCGLSAGLRPGCPVVIRCNGSAVYFGDLLREWVRPSVRIAERLALAQADGVVAVSRFTAEQTARLFGFKTPIGVVPNGVPLSQFMPDGGRTEAGTIVYVGTVVRKKGPLELCRAFSRVVERIPSARLIVVGRDASDRATASVSTWALCQEELSPLARSRTEYLGALPYEGVQACVQRAAVCVFPSHAEALPLSWLEAMACAKPLVAYNIGWAPELVENERTGLLVANGDVAGLAKAIVTLLADQPRCEVMGLAGRRLIEERFSDDVVAAQSLSWYAQVISRTCG